MSADSTNPAGPDNGSGEDENAREAAVECSRALVERIEVDLYLAALTGPRTAAVQAHERPSVIA